MEEDNKIPYFFLGLGVGVALGVLFAPKAGTETRELIKERAGEGKDYLRRRSDELRESATDLIDKGKQTVARQKDQVAAAIDAGKQAYREATTTPFVPPSDRDAANEGV